MFIVIQISRMQGAFNKLSSELKQVAKSPNDRFVAVMSSFYQESFKKFERMQASFLNIQKGL